MQNSAAVSYMGTLTDSRGYLTVLDVKGQTELIKLGVWDFRHAITLLDDDTIYITAIRQYREYKL